MTDWKNFLPLSRRDGSENHEARTRDTTIWGTNPMTHMIMVFLKYCKISPDEKSVLKFFRPTKFGPTSVSPFLK